MTVQIIVGNSLEKLKAMPDKSVHMQVTSPPYWGLRDYGIEPTVWGGDFKCEHVFSEEKSTREIRKGIGLEALSKEYRGGGKKAGAVPEVKIDRGDCQCGAWRGVLGLEPTPDLFVEHMVEIFEECRRVLRDDGTLWLNLGDTYFGGGGYSPNSPSNVLGSKQKTNKGSIKGMSRSGHEGKHGTKKGGATAGLKQQRREAAGLKPKDLVGIPWMVALALRKAGWYLRQEIIWHKPNPMPESTEDRCTKAHEHIFLFAKSPDYFYDADAIKEDAIYGGSGRAEGPRERFKDGKRAQEPDLNQSFRAIRETRNKRSVWTVATRPFAEAHFATFPPDLIEPCILAGTSQRGCCVKCSAPWERIVAPTDRYLEYLGRSIHDHADDAGKGMMQQRGENRSNTMRDESGIISKETETLGWYPSCDCDGLPPLPDLPQSPRATREDGDFDRELTTAEKDQLEEKRAVWRRRCRRVYEQWRELCEPARAIKTKPCVVLDPFGGAGTTGLVADQNQRDAVLIEMNADYAAMAEKRIRKSVMPLFSVA